MPRHRINESVFGTDVSTTGTVKKDDTLAMQNNTTMTEAEASGTGCDEKAG
jgi:hypothetical protein